MIKKAVFLDRDGVINKVIIIDGKPFSPRRLEEFIVLDGVTNVLEKIKKEGFLNIVITNQPDIARHLISLDNIDKMHRFIKENLPIDDIFMCAHDDKDNCNCRKPKPGMLFEAAKKWSIDLKSSFLVGDQERDIKAGENAACTTILIDYPYNKGVVSDFRVNDLQMASEIILGRKWKKYPSWRHAHTLRNI